MFYVDNFPHHNLHEGSGGPTRRREVEAWRRGLRFRDNRSTTSYNSGRGSLRSVRIHTECSKLVKTFLPVSSPREFYRVRGDRETWERCQREDYRHSSHTPFSQRRPEDPPDPPDGRSETPLCRPCPPSHDSLNLVPSLHCPPSHDSLSVVPDPSLTDSAPVISLHERLMHPLLPLELARRRSVSHNRRGF